MIIVTQDNHSVNYNNVVEIFSISKSEGKNFHICAKTISNDYITLGIYETQEKADKILNELNECIVGVIFKRYDMP